MKRFIPILALCLLISGLQAQVIHDPMVKAREVDDFRAIQVSGGIDVYLSQGNSSSLAVSAKTAEWRDEIRTVVEDGVLFITPTNSDKFLQKLGNRQLKAYVSVQQLDKLIASGACDIRVTGQLKMDKFELKLSGASDFNGDIRTNSLEVQLSGASDAVVKGSAKKLQVDVSGASDFKGYDFTVEECSARASGASDINITVSRELQPRASGASSINYRGDAVIRDIQTSGAGSVSKKG